jgi:hypothetical protein
VLWSLVGDDLIPAFYPIRSFTIPTNTYWSFVMNASYRKGYLYATFSEFPEWPDAKWLKQVRLIRVNTLTSTVDDITFGKNNSIEDQPSDLFHYAWPGVAANKHGDIAVVYTRYTAPDQKNQEVRFSVWYHNESKRRPSRLLRAAESDIAFWNDTAGIAVDPLDDAGIWMAHFFAAKSKTGSPYRRIAIGKVFGRPQIFAYDFNTGAGAVLHATVDDKIATDGQQGPSTFGKWTHIVNTGISRVFFYNEKDGSGAVGHVGADSKIVTDGEQGPGTFGKWTHIVGFGNGRVFFYNEKDGSGAVGHVAANGTIATDGQQGPGAFGKWTHVVGFGDGRVFFYNQNNGSGAVGHVAADSTIATDGQQGSGAFDKWTIVSAL